MTQEARQERILPLLLYLFTAVTGLVDAVSYIGLGHIFTANMTGNIVLLGFAFAGVPGLSKLRSLTALAAFLVGALIGGRLATTLAPLSSNRWRMTAFGSEALLLLGATLASIGYVSAPLDATRLYVVIILTALAMGLRNATVRKIAQPDLTTTVLTLTITGLAADSSFAGGSNPRWQRRVLSILFMFAGAVVGALLLRHSLVWPLAMATVSAVCGVAAFYGSRPLERAETPISAKVRNEAQPNPTSARTNHD
ncbi:MAG TPA: YoaK family protein [Edaphobacter sp.]|nr:YoaK family protein [Edaphobacter sp.]